MGNCDWNTRLTLLEKIKDRHDDSAWEDFVHYYQKYIYVILYSMEIPSQTADELSQKIMIKLWEKLPDFEYQQKIGQFRSWLCTVIRNEVHSHNRYHNAAKRQACDSIPEELIDIPCDSELEKLAAHEWNIYVAELAWENISPTMADNYRTIFEQHLRGKSTEEIMESTGAEQNAIYLALKRSRDKLKIEIRRLTNELL